MKKRSGSAIMLQLKEEHSCPTGVKKKHKADAGRKNRLKAEDDLYQNG